MSLNLNKATWERVTFGNAIESVTERVDNPATAGVDRYVGLEHLDPGVMTVQRWDTPDKVAAQKLRFRPSDVIFGRRRAYQKKVALAEFEGICSAHALVLRARPGLIDPSFLPVFLSSDYFLDRAIEISVGSLSPTVNWRDLKGQEFVLPPLDEQKRIAELLWAVEHVRRSLRELQLHLLAVHVSAADEVLDAVEAEAGRVPLTNLVREVITDGVREKGADVDGGVPYVRVSDMTKPQLGIDGMLRMASGLAQTNRSSRMCEGDLVMALRSKIGLCHVIPPDLDGCNIAQGVAKIAPDFNLVSAAYLYEVLMAPRTQLELDRIAKGTTIREVGLRALRSFTIPLPKDRVAQDAIVERFQTMRRSASRVEDELDEVERVRAGIMLEVFGGK